MNARLGWITKWKEQLVEVQRTVDGVWTDAMFYEKWHVKFWSSLWWLDVFCSCANTAICVPSELIALKSVIVEDPIIDGSDTFSVWSSCGGFMVQFALFPLLITVVSISLFSQVQDGLLDD
jgi:hypothetical protein